MEESDRKDNPTGGDRSDMHGENGLGTDLVQDEIYTAEEAMNMVGVGMFQVKLVFLSGFVWMARGFELVVIRNIGSLLTCNWNMKLWHEAIMTTVNILFTILGCFVYGSWSDKYGRRTTLSSSLIFLFVFGAVSAGLPSYVWFVIFRAVSGFAIGGLPQALVLCCECMPGSKRGRAIYTLSCFFALGVILNLSLLFVTVDTPGSWRTFIAIGALPAFIAMIMMRFFPESFHFLLVSNQYIASNEILSDMAESNGKNLCGRLQPLTAQKHRGRIADLFSGQYVRSTLLFWLMGIATAVSFVGLSVMTPHLIKRGTEIMQPSNVSMAHFMGDITAELDCAKDMKTHEFVFAVWTSALDFPSFVIYMILVDLIDRKKLLFASYLLSTMFIFLLFIQSSNIYMPVSFIYCARSLLISQFDMLLLMAAETFPTTHRGTAVGLEAASFYLGTFLSTYIVQALLFENFMFPVITFGILTFLSAIASILLQEETRGKELKDIKKK